MTLPDPSESETRADVAVRANAEMWRKNTRHLYQRLSEVVEFIDHTATRAVEFAYPIFFNNRSTSFMIVVSAAVTSTLRFFFQ